MNLINPTYRSEILVKKINEFFFYETFEVENHSFLVEKHKEKIYKIL